LVLDSLLNFLIFKFLQQVKNPVAIEVIKVGFKGLIVLISNPISTNISQGGTAIAKSKAESLNNKRYLFWKLLH
jgi:hypothetical protein